MAGIILVNNEFAGMTSCVFLFLSIHVYAGFVYMPGRVALVFNLGTPPT